MRDYLRKDVLKTLTATDMDERRESVNGPTGFKLVYAATTLVGLMYRVYDPSVKSFNYIVHVGITTQNGDGENMDDEYEKAYYNAVTDPQVTFNLGTDPNSFNWDEFSHTIIKSQPKKWISMRRMSDIEWLFKKIGLMK